MPGRFITVEGIEGVGKSTNIDFLMREIRDHGFEVVVTREPGGTAAAEKIRELLLSHGDETIPPLAELLLFFAARALNLQNLIRPALEAGKWVICDRFTDASRAYQGAGRGVDPRRIELLADWVHDGLDPDLTLLLDAPVSVGLDRASRRGEADRMESERDDFYERVRAAYLAQAAREPDRIRVIDATGDIERVQAHIRRAVAALLAEKQD